MPSKIEFSKDNRFIVTLENFYQGFAPLAQINSLTEKGNEGHASVMKNVDIINGDYLTQGPALINLTNGTQAGVVSELINFIMDEAVADGQTYGIGNTKLFRITPTTVSSTANFPHTITGATKGESCIHLRGNLYYFYNKSTEGDIGKYNLATTFTDNWGSTVPTGAAAIQNAIHPSAVKEDIMVFGNGRYLGVYTDLNTTLAAQKLDFGNGAVVADVLFHANHWWVAVNHGPTGTNRTRAQIYTYNGAATTAILADEAGVGPYRIGWIKVINGIVYVAYQDLTDTAGGYQIGWVDGRQIKSLGRFTGSLPNYQQKTLYKNTILFIANALVWSLGSRDPDLLPLQVSQLAPGGYATVGALAAPFGTPMVASTDGDANHRLAKFDTTFAVDCQWKSVIIPLVFGEYIGQIEKVIVLTKHLGANARCDLQIEMNQAQSTLQTAKQITGIGKRRHPFDIGLSDIEDFRIALDWTNGSITNDCPIRKIIVKGHLTEVF